MMHVFVLVVFVGLCAADQTLVTCPEKKELILDSGITSATNPAESLEDLVLECNSTKPIKTAEWKFNGQTTTIEKYVTTGETSTAVSISKPTIEFAGTFTVSITLDYEGTSPVEKTIEVNCQPTVLITPGSHVTVENAKEREFKQKGLTVTETSDASIECSVLGHPTPTSRWYYKDEDETEHQLESGDRIEVTNTELNITECQYSDRHVYWCESKNDIGRVAKIATLLRVQSRYRAVWPAIGIAIETIAIGAIIIFCEIRSKKNDQDDAPPDDDE